VQRLLLQLGQQQPQQPANSNSNKSNSQGAYYLKGQRTQSAKHRLSGFPHRPRPLFGTQIAFNCSLSHGKRLQFCSPTTTTPFSCVLALHTPASRHYTL